MNQNWRRNISLRLVMILHEHGITTKALFLSKGWSRTKWQKAKFSPNPRYDLIEEMTVLLGFSKSEVSLLVHGKPEEIVTAPIVYTTEMWKELK